MRSDVLQQKSLEESVREEMKRVTPLSLSEQMQFFYDETLSVQFRNEWVRQAVADYNVIALNLYLTYLYDEGFLSELNLIKDMDWSSGVILPNGLIVFVSDTKGHNQVLKNFFIS